MTPIDTLLHEYIIGDLVGRLESGDLDVDGDLDEDLLIERLETQINILLNDREFREHLK